MNLNEYYSEKVASVDAELLTAVSRDRLISSFRLFFGGGILVSVFFALLERNLGFGMLSAVLLIGFIFLVVRHFRLRKKIVHLRRKKLVFEEELAFLKGDFTLNKDGSAFKNPDHLFADDLDVLGPKSLFQRISRVSSSEAEAILAERLLDKDGSIDPLKQEAIKELVGHPDWYYEFRTNAKALNSANLHQRLSTWTELSTNRSVFLKPIVLWPLSFVFTLSVLALVFLGGLEKIDWLLLPFGLNLFVFSRVLKSLKQHHAFVDQISSDLASYTTLIDLIEAKDWSSAELKRLQGIFSKGEVKSSAALMKLSHLVSQLDSLNNMFGATIFNGAVLYHLHVLRSVLDWKDAYGKEISKWLAASAEMEVWISLANYAFNHPEFNYPVRLSQTGFIAKSIGHPFIKSSERVPNDIEFDGFKFVILTGSNMAGKSTFLRSIGVNLILAKLGLPVCAESMSVSQMKLLTSMKPQDSINDNRSYFQAEIERLRVLVDELEKGEFSMILLDEILRGTNSEDKRNGTVGFLNKINPFNTIGLIATHDIEIALLTDKEPNIYSNRYFESFQEGGELVFDYKLRKGVCHTPNATQLMKLKGII